MSLPFWFNQELEVARFTDKEVDDDDDDTLHCSEGPAPTAEKQKNVRESSATVPLPRRHHDATIRTFSRVPFRRKSRASAFCSADPGDRASCDKQTARTHHGHGKRSNRLQWLELLVTERVLVDVILQDRQCFMRYSETVASTAHKVIWIEPTLKIKHRTLSHKNKIPIVASWRASFLDTQLTYALFHARTQKTPFGPSRPASTPHRAISTPTPYNKGT